MAFSQPSAFIDNSCPVERSVTRAGRIIRFAIPANQITKARFESWTMIENSRVSKQNSFALHGLKRENSFTYSLLNALESVLDYAGPEHILRNTAAFLQSCVFKNSFTKIVRISPTIL